jgi:intracellular multiplication protein IcmP
MHAQSNPRAAWPSHDDNGGFFLVVTLLGLAVLSVVLWINFHGVISASVMDVFHREIGWLRPMTDRFNLADRQMMATNPEDVRPKDLYGIAHAVGTAIRIPAACVILVLAAICMAFAAPSRFKRAFDMDALIAEQAKSFPATAAFVRRRLRLVEPEKAPRPADYAQTPEEWIALHATRKDVGFVEADARRALAAQLGPRWQGPEHAAPHVRALFTVFALHLAEHRTEAQRLLGELSEALADPGKETSAGPASPLALPQAVIAKADALLASFSFDIRSPADRVAAANAYTHPALMSLLNESRLAAGVLAPAQFAWLKLVDRPLWYALHSLGFETEGFGRYLHPNPRVEAAGARDHWAAERIAKRPLGIPDIERALEAVRAASAAERSAHHQWNMRPAVEADTGWA